MKPRILLRLSAVPALVLASLTGCGGTDPNSGGQTGSSGQASVGGGASTDPQGGAINQSGGAGNQTTGGAIGTGGSLVGTGGSSAATGGSSVATGGSSVATGGSSVATGGRASGTGGTSVGTGGRASGTGGTSVGTGGSVIGTGGKAAATGGTLVGTGGSVVGTGGSVVGTGGAAAVCTLPDPSQVLPKLTVGGGGTQYKASDHFIVFGATSPDPTLNFLEAAHQCFVEEWCWRSPGLSITESSGTYYKLNVYSKSLSGAAGVMQYDASAGLAYLEVVPGSIGSSEVVVHELGHALTLTEKGWVDQGRTGLWWEAVANFVSDTFHTSPICEKARADHGIATGRTIIDLNANISNSFNVIVMNGNHYEAWPFLAYLTYNPDNYAGLGKMVLLNMFRTHKRNNETPLHVLERLSAPVTVQTIVGRYWARMAFVDIGHPTAQATFLAGRSRLNYANLTASGTGTYIPITARQPKYCGSNIIPLTVSGTTVSVQITNVGNGQSDSGFTATLAIRSSSGAIRYVDLPDGNGSASVASGEEATLVVANTPKTLYLYDPSNIGASDPANAGLNYRVQLTGATPAN
jgi:hypothetical protein